MNPGIGLFIYPVKGVAHAKTIYSKLLGIEPYMDEAYYVGSKVGDQEIGLVPYGNNKGMTEPVGYWQVTDIKKSLRLLLDAGEQVQQEVTDVGRGKLIASVKDADSNIIGLMQLPLFVALYPPYTSSNPISPSNHMLGRPTEKTIARRFGFKDVFTLPVLMC